MQGADSTEPRADNVQEVASSFDHGDGDKEQPAVLSLWQKVKQHLRRRWWMYLIAIVILLAILLPIL
jgi:uncharacterized membrane protein YdfJ with MMPL/SSD domain